MVSQRSSVQLLAYLLLANAACPEYRSPLQLKPQLWHCHLQCQIKFRLKPVILATYQPTSCFETLPGTHEHMGTRQIGIFLQDALVLVTRAGLHLNCFFGLSFCYIGMHTSAASSHVSCACCHFPMPCPAVQCVVRLRRTMRPLLPGAFGMHQAGGQPSTGPQLDCLRRKRASCRAWLVSIGVGMSRP